MTRQHERRSGPTTEEPHDHDRGLRFDLSTLLDRRQMLKLAAGASLLSLTAAACGGGADSADHRGRHGLDDVGAVGYGSIRRGVRTRSRRRPPARSRPTGRTDPTCWRRAASSAADITCELRRRSPGPRRAYRSPTSSSAWRSGRPAHRSPALPSTCGTATVRVRTRCTLMSPTAGNYLRGVQAADADGRRGGSRASSPAATPAAGRTSTSRCTPTLDAASAGGSRLPATSQIALSQWRRASRRTRPRATKQSVTNLRQVSLESDNVFGDGADASARDCHRQRRRRPRGRAPAGRLAGKRRDAGGREL